MTFGSWGQSLGGCLQCLWETILAVEWCYGKLVWGVIDVPVADMSRLWKLVVRWSRGYGLLAYLEVLTRS